MPGQSLKFSNCSGIPKSCSFNAPMATWSSSRFFDETRTWSPCPDELTPFGAFSLMNLLIALSLVRSNPSLQCDHLADSALRSLLDLPVVERLQ